MERCTEEVLNSLTSARSTSYNDIAVKLLNERLLLTALELHAELCETGIELPILKDYFGNPSNFENQNVKQEPCTSIVRSCSQATLDSLDMTRYSEDGGGTDERVAILEFELRKARENISALRANLTVITESDTSPDKASDKIQLIDLPIKPHEQRALNFLVNEYLLTQKYKLTSITFSDENENQDFEDWEDVGLNIPKPSNLLQIYRDFYRKNDYERPLATDVSIQVQFDDSLSTDFNEICQKTEENSNSVEIEDELTYLKVQITCLEREKFDLEQRLEAIDINRCDIIDNNTQIIETTLTSNATTPDKFEIVDSPHQETFTTNQKIDEEDDSISAVISLGDTGDTDSAEKDWMRIQLPKMHDTVTNSSTTTNLHDQHIPELFKQQIIAYSLAHTFNEDNNTTHYSISNCEMNITLESLTIELAKVLPTIVPYIAVNKRDQVIPLICDAIRLNSDTIQRDRLLQLLFNLKKKPQQSERENLLKTLVSLVKMKDSSVEPEEIITVCWEQSQHKYSERRLLAIECCSALAPYTSSAIKNSLMISMLQQILLEDREAIVRVAVIRTLALLVAFNDDPDKYFQCEELAFAALDDESSQVFDMALAVLLPTLAQWALSLKRLLSHLFTRIISKLQNLIRSDAQLHCSGNDNRSGERAVRLIYVLKTLLPHMIVCIANNSTVKSRINENVPCELPQKVTQLSQSDITSPLVFIQDNVNITKVINTFLTNNWENEMWPELEWLYNKLFPDIMTMIKMIDTTQAIVLNCLLTYIESLCNGFGRHVVIFGIKPIFQLEIVELEKQLIDSSYDGKKLNKNLTLIPAYMLILSTVNVVELLNTLKHFIVLISNSGVDIICIIITIQILLKQSSDIIEQIIGILWDGVVHVKANVRCTTASLFGNIIGNIPEQMVTARVAPAIITLANDSDVSVKAAAVTALGKLITDCTAKEAKDKGRLTLESIAIEINGTTQQILPIALISTLASIASCCPQRYTEDIIVAQLTKTSASILQQNQSAELIHPLLDAFSILVYCPLSIQCINNVLLPGLRNLQTLVNQHLQHENEHVCTLIRETESRLNPMKPIERSTSANSGLSLSLTATNVGQGVEDMRQRMTKIFTPKSHSTSMPSIFRKK